MDVVFWISIFCSSTVLYLGIYVFNVANPKATNIRVNFLALTVALSLWVLGSGCRNLIPESLSRTLPNLILISVAFVPFFLKELTISILERKQTRLKEFQNLEYILLGYLVISCLLSNTITISEGGISIYTPLLAYHVLVGYSTFSIGVSVYWMSKQAILSRGIIRVRSALLMLGTLFGFLISILFVYVLPLLGIFKGYLAVFGILGWVFLWSVAVLQYNAFETRAIFLRSRFMARRELPLLSRLTFKSVLSLHALLDPLDYRLQLRNSRVEVVNYIMQYHMTFQKNSTMTYNTQVRRITRAVERFMK